MTTVPQAPRIHSPWAKRRLTFLGLGLAVPLSFKTFQYFPGIGPLQEAWILLVAMLFLAAYLPWRIRNRGGLEPFEWYTLAVALLVPAWSAAVASREFGQPLLYGLLAQRGFALTAGVPMLISMGLKRGWFGEEEIRRVLLFWAWCSLALFAGMTLLLNPADYFEVYGVGFVNSPNANAIFVFNPIFMVFGFFYYIFRGAARKHLKDYLCAVSFFTFMLVVILGRSLTVCLLLTYLVLAIKWAPNRQRVLGLVVKSLAVLTLALGGLYLVNQELLTTIMAKFGDAFSVVLTGEMTDDPSANARIQQTLVATPYLLRNPFMGNGLLSNQWNMGYESLLGYFHPSDIGILGVLFLYGIAGTVLLAAMFVFPVIFSRRASAARSGYTAFDQAVLGMIFFLGIRSLATGQFAFHAEVPLFFIALVWIRAKAARKVRC